MFRRQKVTERLPWYRERGYKGNLTENDKRKLDSFRLQDPHPAATHDNLPDEVFAYISSLHRHQISASQLGLYPCQWARWL
jgi:hypothetical protein